MKGEGSYGIGMGLIHIIPIPDTMENLWNCTFFILILSVCFTGSFSFLLFGGGFLGNLNR